VNTATHNPTLPNPFVLPIPGLKQLDALYRQLRMRTDTLTFPERLTEQLKVTHRVAEKDLAQIPRSGPVVVVANHPFGILEGAVLVNVFQRLRPDVKILANELLTAIPEIRDLVIAVDPISGKKAASGNSKGLRQAIQHLASGGLLIVFPAGEVSHFQWKQRTIADPPWSPTVARLLALAAKRAPRLAIVPTHIEGGNSASFQLLGMLHPRIRTLLLARELLNKRGAEIKLRVGSPIGASKILALPSETERIEYLRWRTYLLASRAEYRPQTALPIRSSAKLRTRIAPPAPTGAMCQELASLPASAALGRSGDLTVYLARAVEIPTILREIGRLREVTFRAAGEGTGMPSDMDPFDETYQHLFVWHETKREVVGAYRLARTDRVLRLYTSTLFKYDSVFLDRMGPAIELGRSFVRAEYQKSFAPLLLLWNGIGRFVAQNPQYKVLFGPVSISNQYQSLSRELMVSFLERHASLRDWMGLVDTRNPFRRRKGLGLPDTGLDLDDLSDAVSDLEPARTGVPVLLRQYLKLGGKLLAFNVDPNFSDALDGLIVVDLTRTEPRLLSRYLGKTEAAAFLDFQKGSYAA